MEKTKVSVIMPTYNRADIMMRAVSSVLNQTYTNLELIIVDDSSQDNTEQIIQALEDKRIIYIKNSRNRGGNYSRNRGVEIANGEYIAFQDSDDYWEKRKLEIQMARILRAEPQVGMICCGFFRHWGVETGEIEYFPSGDVQTCIEKGETLKRLLIGNFITTPCMLLRKSAIKAIGGFDESLPRLQDWEFAIRTAEKYEIEFVEEALLEQYISDNSISTDELKYVDASCRILRKHGDLFRQYGMIPYKILRLLEYGIRKGIGSETYQMVKEQLPECFQTAEGGISADIAKEYYTTVYDITQSRNKFKGYYSLLNKWIKLKNYTDRGLERYLIEKGYLNVAIYGFGEIGKRLYEELKNSSVNVNYAIERSKKGAYEELPIYNMEDKLEITDIVIVTIVAEVENIIRELWEQKGLRGISLDEVINHCINI